MVVAPLVSVSFTPLHRPLVTGRARGVRSDDALLPSSIGGEQVNAVDGRKLHGFLGVGKDFSAWIPEQVEAFGFQEHQDFEVYSKSGENPTGGRPRKEYLLSLSMAKELAMVQRTEKGKQARLYFIECERRAVAAVQNAVNTFRVPTNLREALDA